MISAQASSGSRVMIAAALVLVLPFAAMAGPTAEERCEAGKNQAAGKYAACLGKAEKDLIQTGDEADYDAALLGCAGKMKDSWSKLEEKAANAGTTCPTTDDQSSIEDFMDACEQSVAAALAGGTLGPDPVTCASDLATCDGDLTTCNGDLGACNGSDATCSSQLGICYNSLASCNTALGTCPADLATCTGSLGTCNAGTAVAGEVAAGKTFSSAAGLGVIGTMPNNGAVTLTPTISDQAIAAGYHNGSGKCAGDADLVSGNIKSGVSLFGVAGSVAPSTCGNAVADGADQCDGSDLDGQTCQGLGYTLGGTLACTAGCAFNTAGCATEHVPASGQTTSYGTGDDGDVQPGATLAYTDNANGTITDNNTGLMWEKKVAWDDTYGSYVNCTDETGTCANPHNANNTYLWTEYAPPYTAYNGAVVTIFLNQMNNRCDKDTTISCTTNADCAVPTGACGFAGHRDWRLPSIKELVGIVDYNIPNPGPTVNSAFDGASCGLACTDITDPTCSCTAENVYWSASTYASYPNFAWGVYFDVGIVAANSKSDTSFVRAVRGGS